MRKYSKVSLGFVTVYISLMPAVQKLESRYGYCSKQDYSVNWISSKIKNDNTIMQHL